MYNETKIFLLFQCQATNGRLEQPPEVQDSCLASEGTFSSPGKNDNVPNKAACECLLVTTNNLH